MSTRSRGIIPEQLTETDIADKPKWLQSLLRKGGHGGKCRSKNFLCHNWDYFPYFISTNISEDTYELKSEDSDQNNFSNYHIVDLAQMEKWINEQCVCKCTLDTDLDAFMDFCNFENGTLSFNELKELSNKWKASRKDKTNFYLSVRNCGIEPIFTMQCKGCKMETSVGNEKTIYYGKSYDGNPTHVENCSWFASNVKLVLGTLASGLGPADISSLFSFIGLPHLTSFCNKTFKKIEDLIGPHLREVADISMTQSLDDEVRKMQEVESFECIDWKDSNEAIGITVSYDMGWNKRSSGRTYNFLSGHAFFVGGYSKKIILSRVASKRCATCDFAKKKGVQPREHICSKNHEGSSKAMEAESALFLVKELDRKTESKVFVKRFVTDDDSSIRALLSHKNDNVYKSKGRLPQSIPEPEWLADPSHRTRIFGRAVYALVNKKFGETKFLTVNAERLKKYFAYMIKQGRHCSLEEFVARSKAVIEHLFDYHEYCDPKWCKPLHHAQEKTQTGNSSSIDGGHNDSSWSPSDEERGQILYYRSKSEHRALYEELIKVIAPYITPERLKELIHFFSTQINEALNNVVAKYAPKNRTYSSTMSLENRISIIIGVHNMGHVQYWRNVLKRIGLPMSHRFYRKLQSLDNKKTWKRNYNSKLNVKRKRIKFYHERQQKLLKQQALDAKRGAMYHSGIAIEDLVVPTAVKIKEKKLRSDGKVLCTLFGCHGASHRTCKSKQCRYHKCKGATQDKVLREMYAEDYDVVSFICKPVQDNDM